MSSVSLAMIVRNEEKHLADCLAHLSKTVNEIVIVDTGSTDNTVAIAQNYTGKVYQVEWEDNFSKARNVALSHCNSEWILSLDADEILAEQDFLPRLIITDKEAYFLPIKSLNGANPDDYSVTCVLRLFRNRSQYKFSGYIHEQIIGVADDKIGISEQPTIIHRYQEPKLRNSKRHRNIRLLQQQTPDQTTDFLALQYYLGCEWLAFHNYRQASNCFKLVFDQLPDKYILAKSGTIKRLVACQRGLGNIKEALALCLQTAAIYPQYTDIFFDGGMLLEQLGEYEAALQWFNAALELGKPPVIYQHLNGTGSFLACYHLGYCCQQLHRTAAAKTWYEQSLAACPSFIYPLSGLFMLLMVQMAPQDLFCYFVNNEFTTTINQKLILAELFFAAGQPEYSALLLNTNNADVAPEGLIKYLVYSGQPQNGLLVDQNSRPAGSSSCSFDLHAVLAFLLLQRYDLAQARCREMWQNPENRPISQALQLLIKQQAYNCCCLPTNYNCKLLIPVWLQILANCQRASTTVFTDLTPIIKACQLLLSATPEGIRALKEYCYKEILNIVQLLDIKYAEVRGLYV